MSSKLLLLTLLCGLCQGDKDDKKWVWNGNSRNSQDRSYNAGSAFQNPKSRYNVFEEVDDYNPGRPFLSNRPPSQVSSIYGNGPQEGGSDFLPPNRPGGLYGGSSHVPNYGSQEPYYPQDNNNPGVLTGPMSSFDKEGPNYNKCKCTERFNCNAPGISYGRCDVGKQYCCYLTKKDFAGPTSKPIHSIENGILVGPGGPVDGNTGINNYPRPPKQLGSGFYRPEGFQRPHGGSGDNYYGGRPGGFREPNEYSSAHGVLVGPGGPYDNPSYTGRSSKLSTKVDKAK